MRHYIVANLDLLEKGLRLYGDDRMSLEHPCWLIGDTRIGRIDVLAVDKHGAFVVIELKWKPAFPAVLGQLLGYLAWVHRHMPVNSLPVRGMIVATDISPLLKMAAQFLPKLRIRLFACPDRSRLVRVL